MISPSHVTCSSQSSFRIQPHLETLATTSVLMSDLPSPTFISPLLPPDVQDDHPQQPSAVSDSARQARLEALERRRLTHESAQSSSSGAATEHDPQPFDDNHAKRIEFRRLVDPGIMRPNSKEVALRSLHVNLKSSLLLAVRGRTEAVVFSSPPIIFDVVSWVNYSPPLPRGLSYRRPCLRSRRICFANPTTPSSVSSSLRI
jgi:hypothetical protein